MGLGGGGSDEGWSDSTTTDAITDPTPDRLGEPVEPSPDSIGPSIPSPPSPEEVDDPRLVWTFWKLVVVCNVGLLGVTVGPMVMYFEGQWDLGLQLVAAGLVLFGYAAFEYYRYQRTEDGSGGAGHGTENAEPKG